MTDKNSNDGRRKLLKSIVAGSGAVVAGKSLPEEWAKPIVDTVLLPAHAETSGLLCTTGPLTITKTISDDSPESIAIIFDGDTCSLSAFNESSCGGACDPDTMLLLDFDIGIDGDDDAGVFDLNSPMGSNWDATPLPELDDQPAGTYTFAKTRTGGANSGSTYSVTFTVSFANMVAPGVTPPSGDMTVSNVSFVAA